MAYTQGILTKYYNYNISQVLDKNFFNNLPTPLATRVEPLIDHGDPLGSVLPQFNYPQSFSIDNDYGAILFEGNLKAPITGSVRLYLEVYDDEWAGLYLNGSQIETLEKPEHIPNPKEVFADVQMVQGQYIPFLLKYVEFSGNNLVRLSWSYNGQPKQIIPAINYTHGAMETLEVNGGSIGEIPFGVEYSMNLEIFGQTDKLVFLSSQNITNAYSNGTNAKFTPVEYGAGFAIYELQTASNVPISLVRFNFWAYYDDVNFDLATLTKYYGVNQTHNFTDDLQILPALPAGMTISEIELSTETYEITNLSANPATKIINYKVDTQGGTGEVLYINFTDANGNLLIRTRQNFDDGIELPPSPILPTTTTVETQFNVGIPASNITDVATLTVLKNGSILNVGTGLQGSTLPYNPTSSDLLSFNLNYNSNTSASASTEITPNEVILPPPNLGMETSTIPTFYSQSPQLVGFQIGGLCQGGATIKIFKNGVYVTSVGATGDGFFYTATEAGNYTFKQTEFGKLESDFSTVFVINAPLIVAPPAPIAQVQSGLIGTPINGTIQQNGTVIIFKNGVEILRLVNQVGSFAYTPATAGSYSFKLENQNGISLASQDVIVPQTFEYEANFVSSCGNSAEYAISTSINNANAGGLVWQLSNLFQVLPDTQYYLHVREVANHSNFSTQTVRTSI